jgi:hypothetical protein
MMQRLPAPMNPLEATYRLSAGILLEFLGPEWIDYYLTHRGLSLEEGYLGRDLDTHSLRTYALAELLLNLRHISGFQECLLLVAGGDLEAAFAELEVAKLLSWANVRFNFNQRTGKGKSDYDLNVFFRNGERGCGETKCKIEDNTVTAQSVLNTLQKARKQLPNDRPGVIFLRMPEQWARNIDAKENITPAIESFMRVTQTVVAVEIFASGFNDVGAWFNRSAAPFIQGTEVINVCHKFDRTRDWSLIGPLERTQVLPPIWWKSIPALIDPRIDPRYRGPI